MCRLLLLAGGASLFSLRCLSLLFCSLLMFAAVSGCVLLLFVGVFCLLLCVVVCCDV